MVLNLLILKREYYNYSRHDNLFIYEYIYSDDVFESSSVIIMMNDESNHHDDVHHDGDSANNAKAVKPRPMPVKATSL